MTWFFLYAIIRVYYRFSSDLGQFLGRPLHEGMDQPCMRGPYGDVREAGRRTVRTYYTCEKPLASKAPASNAPAVSGSQYMAGRERIIPVLFW
jgi:hypothetical protein